MSNTDILKNYEAEYEAIMADKAVTNISGWTEPNNDIPCDEDEYRKRLLKNGEPLRQKLKEALNFE